MVAPRMQRIPASGTVKISNLVSKMRGEGKDVISFAVGEPDFPTPAHIIEAAKRAMDDGFTHYTPSAGIPELREAIARKCKLENGLPAEPGHVIVTPTKHSLYMTCMALADEGDEIIIPDPSWVSYGPMVQAADAKAVPVALDEDFRMRPEAVAEAITPKTKAIIINTPSNPTGGTMPLEDLKGIADLALDNDITVVSDEIYEKLLYEGEHHSIGALPGMYERTVTVNGFSKAYAMTGWRVGWLAATGEVFKAISKLQQHTVTCACSFAQKGAVAALEGTQQPVEEMRKEFLARRDMMVKGLNDVPAFNCNVPQGAFYVFPRYDLEIGSQKLAEHLLKEAGVAVTPGAAFGEKGEGHVRISYATSRQNIESGLAKIAAAMEKL